MKGITLCGQCAYYSMKQHRCTRGAHIEKDPKEPFYAGCPLPNVAPVVHGRWVNPYMNRYGHPCHCCSVCGFKASYQDRNYCPNCGAKMDK